MNANQPLYYRKSHLSENVCLLKEAEPMTRINVEQIGEELFFLGVSLFLCGGVVLPSKIKTLKTLTLTIGFRIPGQS